MASVNTHTVSNCYFQKQHLTEWLQFGALQKLCLIWQKVLSHRSFNASYILHFTYLVSAKQIILRLKGYPSAAFPLPAHISRRHSPKGSNENPVLDIEQWIISHEVLFSQPLTWIAHLPGARLMESFHTPNRQTTCPITTGLVAG